MQMWYVKDEDRYHRELQALDEAGIKYIEDQKAKAQNILCLCLTISKENPNFKGLDTDLELSVIYPDLYPFFRPEVYSSTLKLPRHQNPFGKNLCLLPRSTSSWRPEDTLAELLKLQLNAILIQGKITEYDELSKDESEQAEPISEYYSVGNYVIFDTSPYENTEVPNTKFETIGTFKYGIPSNEKPIRLAVLNCFDDQGNGINSLPLPISKIFEGHTGMGVVCRVNQPPPENPQNFLGWVKARGGNNIFNETRSSNLGGIIIEYVIGINFPEEIEPGKDGSGWLFYIKSKQKNGNGDKHFHHYAKALRANRSAYSERVPKLKTLADKKIALIGLGALGAPAAIEFARNGIKEIKIIDYDYVDPPTSIRWPLGMASAGLQKTASIKKFIEENYPYSTVVSVELKIGQTNLQKDNSQSSSQILDEVFSDVSLIFDASAEIGVMNYLSLQAKERGIPYISIEATEGVLGGQIMRVNPKNTKGCWMCLQYAQFNGLIPVPPKDNSGKLQAIGCGDLSFTGTSFDLQNISTAGVRLAVSTLCEGAAEGYPSLDLDVSILSLVDDTGKAISPQWKDYKLDIHPQCPYCANRE